MSERLPHAKREIFLMNQEGVSKDDKRAVIDGIKELVSFSGVNLNMRAFGVWRNKEYIKERILQEFQSIDWYVENARQTNPNNYQLNVDTLLWTLYVEPWRYFDKGGKPHYDIVVLNEDLHSKDCNYVIGLSMREIGTALSTMRFGELNRRERYECVKTETIHELGHTFGLPNEKRPGLVESLGTHCGNVCVMRQGLDVPQDWIKMSHDRIKHGALCPDCKAELKEFFQG